MLGLTRGCNMAVNRLFHSPVETAEPEARKKLAGGATTGLSHIPPPSRIAP
jgi:hypothetical protein